MLLENAFIIYETSPPPYHELIISPPIQNYLSINFLPKKVYPPAMKSCFWKKSLPYFSSGSTKYTSYFVMIVHDFHLQIK